MASGRGPIANLEGKVNASNELAVTVSGGISGADGSLLDGVDPSLKATVLDLTTANPLTVAIVDGNGDQIASFGGGTQYTEDAAAAANPVGTIAMLVREDARGGNITSTDGDNVAQRGNNKGEAYVIDTDLNTAVGTATTAAVSGDNNGSAVAHLRGLNTNLAAVLDLGNGRVIVDGSEVTQPVSDGGGSITIDGTVAVSAVTPGTAATSLGKAEDAAHTSGDVGVMALAVRQSSQADFGADGDYVPFSVDDDGGLRVSIVAGAGSGGTASADDADFTAGTTSGTPSMGVYESSPTSVTDGDLGVVGITAERALKVAIVSGAGSGGTASADDADFTAGTTSGTPAMGVYESSPSSVTDGDMGLVGITQTRAMRVQAQANGGVDIGDVTINNASGASAVNIQDGGNSITVDNAALSVVGGGAEATALRVTLASDSTGVLSVDDNGGSLTVDGTVAVSTVTTVTTVSAVTAISNALPAGTNNIGDVDVLTVNAQSAHDAAIAGLPVRIGARAESTDIAAVADGDTTDLVATTLGKLVNYPHATPGQTWQYAAVSGGVTDTADDVAQAAAGAGIRNYIKHVSVVNAHATVGTEVVIKDGSTVIWRSYAVAAGGGVSESFDPPLRGTANTAVNVTNITTGSATYFNLQGFFSAE